MRKITVKADATVLTVNCSQSDVDAVTTCRLRKSSLHIDAYIIVAQSYEQVHLLVDET